MPTFETPGPIDVYVEIGSGSVHLTAGDVTETIVDVSGARADEVTVELSDGKLAIVGPRWRGGFLGGDAAVHVRATVPAASSLTGKTGSADLTAEGTWAKAMVKAGSGQVDLAELRGPTVVDAGSGGVHVGFLADQGRIKSGSGDVGVDAASGPLVVSCGSGDVRIDRSDDTVVLKSGSGRLRLGRAAGDVDVSTGSGSVHLDHLASGRLRARTASGAVSVGVPAGVPVWTDISSVSGRVRSDLQGAGRPTDGQPHLELRVTTASGDITLHQL